MVNKSCKIVLSFGIITLFLLSSIPMTLGYNISNKETSQSTTSSNGGLMNSSWPMYGHDVKHTSRSPYEPNMGNTPIVNWKFWMDGRSFSSPSIDENGTILVGAEDFHDSFFALYPNGTEKWRFDAGDWVDSSPAIDEDSRIYFGSAVGKFFALNPDGTKRWHFNGGGWFFSSPLIDENGTIYVGNTDNVFYAINPNGTEKWRYETNYKIYSSAAIDDNGIIYFGSHDKYLYALNSNGTLNWRFRTNGELKSSPTIADDGTIYICSWDYYLYAVNPNGTLRWKFNTGAATETSPSLALDGTIYFGNNVGRIFSVNPEGTKNWHFDTGDTIYASPVIDINGIIYIGSMDDYLYALNPNGSLKWKFNTGRGIESSVAIGKDGTIYFVGQNSIVDSYLYALDVIYNEPPSTPDRPSGETNGKIGNEYTYTTSTTDPEGNDVYYWFDWGDGSNSGWIGPFNSDNISNASHTWTSEGDYDIKVKAKDIYEAQSDWSDSLTVSITKKSKSLSGSVLLRLIEQFPLLNLLLQRLRI